VIPYRLLSRIMAGGAPTTNELNLLLSALRVAFIVFVAINFLAAAISPIRGVSERRAVPTLELE